MDCTILIRGSAEVWAPISENRKIDCQLHRLSAHARIWQCTYHLAHRHTCLGRAQSQASADGLGQFGRSCCRYPKYALQPACDERCNLCPRDWRMTIVTTVSVRHVCEV